jgi:hypothetical protein
MDINTQISLQNEISYLDYLKREVKSHQRNLNQVGGATAPTANIAPGAGAFPPMHNVNNDGNVLAAPSIEQRLVDQKARTQQRIVRVKTALTNETQNLRERINALASMINTDDGNIQTALKGINDEIVILEQDIQTLGFDTDAAAAKTAADTARAQLIANKYLVGGRGQRGGNVDPGTGLPTTQMVPQQVMGEQQVMVPQQPQTVFVDQGTGQPVTVQQPQTVFVDAGTGQPVTVQQPQTVFVDAGTGQPVGQQEMMGGSAYTAKYLKYKQKYLQLKNRR